MDESIVKHLEQPKVGTLRLSEAMRAGARITGQCRGVFWDDNGNTCALGAAWIGNGGGMENIDIAGCIEFAISIQKHGIGILSAIYERNDSGHTREEIAAWLESQGL